jgi:hypothetical protein
MNCKTCGVPLKLSEEEIEMCNNCELAYLREFKRLMTLVGFNQWDRYTNNGNNVVLNDWKIEYPENEEAEECSCGGNAVIEGTTISCSSKTCGVTVRRPTLEEAIHRWNAIQQTGIEFR